MAAAAEVSRGVIIDFEKERRVPGRNNLAAIRTALEAAGVEFINHSGVRLRA
ncbi:transcriptional regulator [Mesorhizobium sp. M0118]|uniref:transcriptional regulator n=1 Tax=Mesorhizobium sp. M0118 TaxID=2956884 RepID=UPI003339D2DB